MAFYVGVPPDSYRDRMAPFATPAAWDPSALHSFARSGGMRYPGLRQYRI